MNSNPITALGTFCSPLRGFFAATVIGCCLLAQAARLDAVEAKTFGPDATAVQAAVDRAIQFLTLGQEDDGSFSARAGIGPTALATLGLLRQGRTPQDPLVAKGLAYLEGFVQPSGGIHAPNGRLANYETCIAVMCFKEANRGGKYDEIIQHAEAFIRDIPWDESDDREPSDLSYGGAGYGAKSRPDLSNTSFLLDALKSCGAGPEDEALQKALVFVSRCQNLESEHNTTEFAAKVNDGGFYYTCVLEQQNEERQTANGGLRSYGAMSYSGLKSMIYAGLTQDDPRVQAAVKWIRDNYDLASNPGMGDAGLYYYYHTFAKALDALGVDEIEDAQGVQHDWRRELADELLRRQRPDGAWVNSNNHWFEGDANLVTAYAILTLSYCQPSAAE